MSILMTTQNQGSNSTSLVRLLFSWASPSFWSVFLPGKAAQHLEEIKLEKYRVEDESGSHQFFCQKKCIYIYIYIYIHGNKIETKITLAMFKISFSIMQKINFRYLFIYFFKLKIEKKSAYFSIYFENFLGHIRLPWQQNSPIIPLTLALSLCYPKQDSVNS